MPGLTGALKNSFLIMAIAATLLLRITGAGKEVALAAGFATGMIFSLVPAMAGI